MLTLYNITILFVSQINKTILGWANSVWKIAFSVTLVIGFARCPYSEQ